MLQENGHFTEASEEPLSLCSSLVTIGYSSTHFLPSHSFLSSSLDVESSPCSLISPLLHSDGSSAWKIILLHETQACTYLLCVSVSQYLNVEPINSEIGSRHNPALRLFCYHGIIQDAGVVPVVSGFQLEGRCICSHFLFFPLQWRV